MHTRRNAGIAVGLALALLFCPATASADSTAHCALRTGLDPACPVSRAGATLSARALSLRAHRQTAEIFATHAWQGSQSITVALPLYDRLRVGGEGNAYGAGDLSVNYTSAFAAFKRWKPFAGIAGAFNTGALTFTAGRSSAGPIAGLSYVAGNRVAFVVQGSYDAQLGGSKLPFAPRVQELTVMPRVIATWPKSGLFTAFDVRASSVTGDERYRAYAGDAFLGIVRGDDDFTLRYSTPATAFTRNNVFFGAFELQAALRR